jgi:cytochrome b561
MNSTTTHYYHPLSVAGHWIGGVLALVCMLTVLIASILGRIHPIHDELMRAHMWSGQGLFLINLLRLLVHSACGCPEPAGVDDSQKMASAALHALLYGLVGFLACTGILLLLAHAAGQQWFGVTVPLVLAGGAVMLVAQCHQLAGLLLLFVTLGHILFAIALHTKGEDSVLSRMKLGGKKLDYLTALHSEDNYARLDSSRTHSLGKTRSNH